MMMIGDRDLLLEDPGVEVPGALTSRMGELHVTIGRPAGHKSRFGWLIRLWAPPGREGGTVTATQWLGLELVRRP